MTFKMSEGLIKENSDLYRSLTQTFIFKRTSIPDKKYKYKFIVRRINIPLKLSEKDVSMFTYYRLIL